MIKKLLKVVGFIIVFTLLQYFTISFVSIIASLICKKDIDSFLASNSFYNITLITSILFTLICIFILSKRVKYEELSYKKILICLLLGILFAFCFHLIKYLFFKVEPENFNVLLILSTGILGPILEEIMFRGLIYNYLKEENKKQGMLLTTLLFALSHNGISNILYAFILGIILIYLQEHYKSLKAPISFHIGVNTMAILFTCFI